MPDSTNEQQLIVANFSMCIPLSSENKPTSSTFFIDGSYGQVQFIASSEEVDLLFAAGADLSTNISAVGIIEDGVRGRHFL
jgi:hypothetical protein